MAIESSITSQIVTLLESISAIQEVSNYEKSSFRGFPAATVVGSDNESDFEGNQERHRIYAFTIRMYIEFSSDAQGGSGEGLKEVDRILRSLSDTVIDTFDNPTNARFSGNADSTAEKVLFVEPTPSSWFYDVDRKMRGKEIKLKVHTYLNTSLL